jgi:hypothetical protein
MEEKIIKECQRAGIDPGILTEQEKQMLAKEIEAKERGKKFFDGVLDDPDIRARMMV